MNSIHSEITFVHRRSKSDQLSLGRPNAGPKYQGTKDLIRYRAGDR
jgi:hypothetical protein